MNEAFKTMHGNTKMSYCGISVWEFYCERNTTQNQFNSIAHSGPIVTHSRLKMSYVGLVVPGNSPYLSGNSPKPTKTNQNSPKVQYTHPWLIWSNCLRNPSLQRLSLSFRTVNEILWNRFYAWCVCVRVIVVTETWSLLLNMLNRREALKRHNSNHRSKEWLILDTCAQLYLLWTFLFFLQL